MRAKLKNIHKTFKREREKRKLTIAQMSNLTGIPESTLHVWENYHVSLAYLKFYELCKFYKINLNDIDEY